MVRKQLASEGFDFKSSPLALNLLILGKRSLRYNAVNTSAFCLDCLLKFIELIILREKQARKLQATLVRNYRSLAYGRG